MWILSLVMDIISTEYFFQGAAVMSVRERIKQENNLLPTLSFWDSKLYLESVGLHYYNV